LVVSIWQTFLGRVRAPAQTARGAVRARVSKQDTWVYRWCRQAGVPATCRTCLPLPPLPPGVCGVFYCTTRTQPACHSFPRSPTCAYRLPRQWRTRGRRVKVTRTAHACTTPQHAPLLALTASLQPVEDAPAAPPPHHYTRQAPFFVECVWADQCWASRRVPWKKRRQAGLPPPLRRMPPPSLLDDSLACCHHSACHFWEDSLSHSLTSGREDTTLPAVFSPAFCGTCSHSEDGQTIGMTPLQQPA